MKNPEKLLETYLRNLRVIRSSGAGVAETSYYEALSALLTAVGKDLKPSVRCILQLGNRGAGSPDGGMFTQDQLKDVDYAKPLLGLPQPPSRGVVEVKPTRDDAWVTASGEQVTRYWDHYRLVLVTNYRDFVLVGSDTNGNAANLETYRLAPSEKAFWDETAYPATFAQKHQELIEFLARCEQHAAPLTSARDVAWFMASYARTSLKRIEGKNPPALTTVRSALEDALGLQFVGPKGDHFFRSTFVQTLFYGIFSAWVLWSKSHPASSKDLFRWQDTAWFLQVPVVQKLFYMMADPATLNSLDLVEVLEWTAALLNRIDRGAFFGSFEENKAVQYFYEPFLEAFDPVLRKDLGVWFTPPEIVKYMVARVDSVLRDELSVPDGLANPNVYVLDPCCGTGSYVVEVLKVVHETLKQKHGDSLVANDVKEAAMHRVFGFELLPAPFVVAHLQLGLLLQNINAPLSSDKHERVGVHLTNALTGWEPLDEEKEKVFQARLRGFPELLEEHDSAREVKIEKPILVILGNPPYNAFAGTSPTEERGLVEPYKSGLTKEWGIKKFNLDDLYVRFFRLAERRIAEYTGRGVVSFISNNSWVSDRSFVVLRKHLLDSFDEVWIENLHGDRTISEYAPDGRTSETIFAMSGFSPGIRQGLATTLWIKRETQSGPANVRFRDDIQAARAEERRAELLHSIDDLKFRERYSTSNPTVSNYLSFRPSNVDANYQKWPRLADLAQISFNGLMEKRGGALIDIDRNALAKRLAAYFDSRTKWSDLANTSPGLTENAARFEAESARRKVLKAESFDESRLVRYALRPLDSRWCYFSPVRPLWNEPRPALWAQFKYGNSYLMSRPAGVAEPEGAPVSFTTCLGDNDYLRGHAYYFPFMLTDKASKPNENQFSLPALTQNHTGQRANLSVSARGYLEGLGISGVDSDVQTSGLIWMHSLAIAFSPMYVLENSDGVREDWPRIPLPTDPLALKSSAALGQQIATILNTEESIARIPDLQFIGLVTGEKDQAVAPEGLSLTAGWGHLGSAGAVMPGKGRVSERDYTEQELAALTKAAEAIGLSLGEALDCLGHRTCDVYLNEHTHWRNVPSHVWAYFIGGYQVIKKWLSYREQPLLGRALTEQEAREVSGMARRLASLLLLSSNLDANYQRCKGSAYSWPEPQAGSSFVSTSVHDSSF